MAVLLVGVLVRCRRMLVSLLAVLKCGGGMLLGFFVVALIVLMSRLMVVVLGGAVMGRSGQMMFGGGMLCRCHKSETSLVDIPCHS